jgi:pilus assembly protein Flp/PilA
MFAVAYQILTNLKREDGQTMAEYGLILALVAVAAVGAYFALGGDISGVINNVTGSL